MRAFIVFLLSLFWAPLAFAQERQPSHCIAIADALPGVEFIHRAAFDDPVAQDSLRIRYITHAAFLVLSEGGASAVTDFTGYIGNVPFLPDVVTMNIGHDSHWTPSPDPAIPHVLKGWGNGSEGAEHHLTVKDMLIRNVPTDIRRAGGVGIKGNSIFVFEAAGLCVGHLGHLHHEPDDAQYAALGRLDVVMAAVDGGRTLDLPSMKRVLNRLKASVVIPMHWFGTGTLNQFLSDMSDSYLVENKGDHALEISLRTLPDRPTIVVLQPKYLMVEE
ncbi:MAG: MBL fold metallo-hydrolase [Cognatishimia sp.]|uniref:MBL fold metallo-hydrolase n=1 Tax=Cognatishimia sp. TaxID=2211648 RepID=UPI003B8AD7BE